MTKENISIVSFSNAHIDGIMAIDKLSFSLPASLDYYKKELQNKSAKYIVATKNGQILGYAALWLIVDEGHLINIAVHPEYRGIGISKMLLDELIKICKNFDITSMTLEVRASNNVAINLYHKYGFKDSGIRKGYYADNKEDAIIMWKKDI